LVARNSITITGPFEAKLGSTFEAIIDPYFGGFTSIIANTSDLNRLKLQEIGAPGEQADSIEGPIPENIRLHPNYPNPFNASTEIHFSLLEASHVQLVVYDVLGREVDRLVDGFLEAGDHRVRWEAASVPSGVYLYRLQASSFTKTQRMTLLK
jgi:hypothetical protein